jgi:predicted protein tyrosine phosphatase
MPLSVLRDLSEQGGSLVFGPCPGLVIQQNGSLALSDELLAHTVRQLRDLCVRTAIVHIEPAEISDVDYEDIADAMAAGGIRVTRCPIPDFSVPDSTLQEALEPMWRELAERIRQGEGVFLHCLAGDGRSALMAGCLLVRLGMSGQEALGAIRTIRPSAIETAQQLAYLLAQPAGASSNSP